MTDMEPRDKDERIAELEAKSAQAEARRHDLERLLQSLDTPTALMDSSGIYRFVNRAFCESTGLAEDELVGHGIDIIAEHLHPEDLGPTGAAVVQAVAENRKVYCEFRRLTADGSYRWTMQEASPWRGPGGELLGIAVSISDIEEKKRTEAELLHAQKQQALGALAAGVAHDFNNLLTVIMLSAGHALAQTEHDALAHSLLEKVMDASDRARKLTLNLLALARRTRPQALPSNLNSIVENLLTILERGVSKTVGIRTEFADGLPMVMADRIQIEHALLNICNNACDAMPGGGTITITTRESAPGFCEVCVADTGRGMSDQELSRCFEPLFTTKEPGRGPGLGLSLTRSIADNHGGEVAARSEPGRGSEFTLRLPVAGPEQIAAAVEPGLETQTACSETLLVVDDERFIVEVTARLLEVRGYKVIKAVSALEGLELFRERSGEIDLALSDIMMPDMTGEELLGELRSIDPGIRVVLFSGYANKAQVRGLDIQGFLQKPFRPEELYRTIRTALDSDST